MRHFLASIFGGRRDGASAGESSRGRLEQREMSFRELQLAMSDGEPTMACGAPESVPAVYRAVSLIAGDIARARLSVSDPAVEMLLAEPDPMTSGYELRQSLTAQALTRSGNGYAYIARQQGEPVALQRLDPCKVRIVASQDRKSWGYEHSDMGPIARQDMLHIRGIVLSGVAGVSPLSQCREAVRLAGRTIAMTNRKMGGGGTGKLALVAEGKADDPVVLKMKELYQRDHSGEKAEDNPLVLHSGFKPQRIGLTLEELTWPAVAKYNIEEVARMYGVPVSYLFGEAIPGDGEAIGRLYVNGCLAHWAEVWRSEIWLKLGARVDFDLDRLVRPGYAALMAGNRSAVECGILNIDEARDTIDKPELPNGEGKQRLVAKNLGTGGGTSNLGVDTSLGAGQ